MKVDFSKFEFDKNGNIAEPEMYLLRPDMSVAGCISDASEITAELYFNDLSTVSFSIPKTNSVYDEIEGKKLIEFKPYGIFRLENPIKIKDANGKSYKKCTAQSLECEFKDKTISDIRIDGIRLYNPELPLNEQRTDTVIGIIMNLVPAWKFNPDVHTDLQDLYRSFDVSSENLYKFMMDEVQKAYGCIFVFDTITRTVGIKAIDELGVHSTVYLSDENVVKSLEIEELSEEIVTCIEPYGNSSDVDIRSVNPRGDNKIYNFDYYLGTRAATDKWFKGESGGGGLYEAWKRYSDKFKVQQTAYRELKVRQSAYNAKKIAIEGKIVDLEYTLEAHQNILDGLIEAGINSSANKQYKEIKMAISNTEDDISNSKSELKACENEIKDIDTKLTAINVLMALENNFTVEQLKKLDTITFCDTYKNDALAYNNYEFSGEPDYSGKIVGTSLVISGKYSSVASADESSKNKYYEISDSNISVTDSESGNVFDLHISKGYITNFADTKEIIITGSIVSGNITTNEKSVIENASISFSGVYSELNTANKRITINGINSYCYITRESTANDRMQVCMELYDYVNNTIMPKIYSPSYEFEIDASNFVFIKEYSEFRRTMEFGDCVCIEKSEGNTVNMLLLKMKLDYDNPNSFSITFSNKIRAGSAEFDMEDLFEEALTGGRNSSFERSDYNAFAGTNAKTALHDFITSALDTSKNAIISSSDQSFTINSNGIRGKRVVNRNGDSEPESYSDEQIWINNNSIVFTDDNWETARTAIGKIYRNDNTDCIEISGAVDFVTGAQSISNKNGNDVAIQKDVIYYATNLKQTYEGENGQVTEKLKRQFVIWDSDLNCFTVTGAPIGAGFSYGIVAESIYGTLIAGERLQIEATSAYDTDETVTFRVDGSGAWINNGAITCTNSESGISVVIDAKHGIAIGRNIYTYDDNGEYRLNMDSNGKWNSNAKPNFYVDTSGNIRVRNITAYATVGGNEVETFAIDEIGNLFAKGDIRAKNLYLGEDETDVLKAVDGKTKIKGEFIEPKGISVSSASGKNIFTVKDGTPMLSIGDGNDGFTVNSDGKVMFGGDIKLSWNNITDTGNVATNSYVEEVRDEIEGHMSSTYISKNVVFSPTLATISSSTEKISRSGGLLFMGAADGASNNTNLEGIISVLRVDNDGMILGDRQYKKGDRILYIGGVNDIYVHRSNQDYILGTGNRLLTKDDLASVSGATLVFG